MPLLRNLWPLCFVLSYPALAQEEPPLLRGIEAVTVSVDVSGPAAAFSSEDRIRTITELRLRTAGLIVR
jgi:hypothetical protein